MLRTVHSHDRAKGDLEGQGIVGKRMYEPPRIERVELALEETLSSGCKLGTDSVCVGPPIAVHGGGS